MPCDELAGDTLNIVPLDEHHVACFVIDVRGHGVLDLEQQEFRFVSAGHPYLAHIPSGGESELLEPTGTPIGLVPESIMPPAFTECTVELQPGDRVFMYSDGIPEAANPAGEKFGKERLIEILGDLREHGLEASIQALLDRVAVFSETPEFEDDVSVITFEVR